MQLKGTTEAMLYRLVIKPSGMRAGAPYMFCVARKTRLPCSLQAH